MSLFDWMADKDDRIDDWPPPGADACELCGGAGQIDPWNQNDLLAGIAKMTCPECDGSGWAQGERNVN